MTKISSKKLRLHIRHIYDIWNLLVFFFFFPTSPFLEILFNIKMDSMNLQVLHIRPIFMSGECNTKHRHTFPFQHKLITGNYCVCVHTAHVTNLPFDRKSIAKYDQVEILQTFKRVRQVYTTSPGSSPYPFFIQPKKKNY